MLSELQELKLRLITHGVALSPKAKVQLSQNGRHPLTLADYPTTSGITLDLGSDIWVNAPILDFNPNFVSSPGDIIDTEDSRFLIKTGSKSLEVEIAPVPAYHDKLNSSGEPYTDYAITHADRVRISPIEGCSIACSFCDIPFESRYRRRRVDGLLDSVERALADPRLPAKHILISGGTPHPRDYSYQQMVYQAVTEHFPDVKVDLMMVPMPELLDPQQLKAMGIWGLSINIEIVDEDIARAVMPVKARLGFRHFLEFIESSVSVFGVGRVRSLLLVGLEPLESTLRGVQELAARGCEPVLSPFRPDPATPLSGSRPPSVDFLKRAFSEARRIVENSGGKLGPRCIPCQHNTLTFPDGSDYYYYS